jgi:hypothetical protein
VTAARGSGAFTGVRDLLPDGDQKADKAERIERRAFPEKDGLRCSLHVAGRQKLIGPDNVASKTISRA